MTEKDMNPVDRINLVSMQQDRKLHEKRCEVQELERVKRELEKTLNDLKKENEEKQQKLDKKREYNNKMRKVNERFKKHLKLIDEHNELLEEKNTIAEENCSKELARYENLVKTSVKKEQEHIKIYEQFPHVQEQKEWSLKLQNIKIQLWIEQTRVNEQIKMNIVMHRIQQGRLNNSIVQFAKRVMDLWKHQDKIEAAKNQKQTLIVRLNSMKEKIALHQSRSMQLEFQVPQSFLEQAGNVSNTIPHSSTASSLKKLESNLLHTLSKFTTVAKVTDSVPRNQLSPSSFNKGTPHFSQTRVHKSDDLIKKLSQMTALKTIRSSKDKVPEANFKTPNPVSKEKVSLGKKQETSSTSDHIPPNQTTPLTKQNSNLFPENKSSPVIKRKRENSESNIKLGTSVENTQKSELSLSNNKEKEPEPVESTKKNNELNPKIAPINKKVRFDQKIPQILNIEVIQPPKNPNMDDGTHEITSEVGNIPEIEQESVSFMSNEPVDQESTQNSQNVIKNYDQEIADARSHMSFILDGSPEYPAAMGDFASPPLSSNEGGSDNNEATMNIPTVQAPKPAAKTTFSIFGRKSSEKTDNKGYRLF